MKNKVQNIGSFKDVQDRIQQDEHEIIALPNGKNIGIIDFEKCLTNLSTLVEKGTYALENKFYLEFISLKILYLEFYLKIFWVNKNPEGKILSKEDRKFFGRLIHECREYGFDPDLIGKIDLFNKARAKAIHSFLMGGIDESELETVCQEYSKLGNELFNYVIEECGELIEDVNQVINEEGSMIITRAKK